MLSPADLMDRFVAVRHAMDDVPPVSVSGGDGGLHPRGPLHASHSQDALGVPGKAISFVRIADPRVSSSSQLCGAWRRGRGVASIKHRAANLPNNFPANWPLGTWCPR